jgi:hypothetical protein
LLSPSSPTPESPSKNTSKAKRNNETNAQIRHEAKSELAQHTSVHSRGSGRSKNQAWSGWPAKPDLCRSWRRAAGGSPAKLGCAPDSQWESGATGLCAGRAGARPGAHQDLAGEQNHAKFLRKIPLNRLGYSC